MDITKNKNSVVSIAIATIVLIIVLIQIWLPYKISNHSNNEELIVGAKQMGLFISFAIHLFATLITPFIWVAVYISIRYLIYKDRETRTSHILILCTSIMLAMLLMPFIFRWPY